MHERIFAVTALLAAASVLAQSPQDMSKMARADFERLDASALVSFDGRTWSKSELQAHLEALRRKALPSGFNLENFDQAAPRLEKQWLEQLGVKPPRPSKQLLRDAGKVRELGAPKDPKISGLEPDPLVPACGEIWGKGVIFGDGLEMADAAMLTGQFPGGPVKLNRDLPETMPPPWGGGNSAQEQLELERRAYFFTIPCVAKIADHTAKVQVWANNKPSNELPVRIVAYRKTVQMAPSWVEQGISSSGGTSGVLRPKDFPPQMSKGWDMYGARHRATGLATGIDTLKVVVPSPCSLVRAKTYWRSEGGSSAAAVWEKSRKLTDNKLELEIGWFVFGDGVEYGVQVGAVGPIGLSCS